MRIWNRIEDQWYALLDRLDEAQIPVYSIVDPVDKIAPSLLVFIGLLLLGSFALVTMTPSSNPEGTPLLVRVVDETNTPLWGARVALQLEGNDHESFTDKEGHAAFTIPNKTPFSIHAAAEGYLPAEAMVNDGETTIQLVLQPSTADTAPHPFYITFPGGMKADTIPVTLTLVCSSNQSEPHSLLTTTGTFAWEKGTCEEWNATVTATGYHTETHPLNFEKPVLELQPLPAPMGIIEALVVEGSSPVDGIMMYLHREDGTLIENRMTDSSGKVRFVSVPYGKYYLTSSDADGTYAPFTGSIFSVTQNTTYAHTILLSIANSNMPLTFQLQDAQTQKPIPGAELLFIGKGKTIPSFVLVTNPLGLAVLPIDGAETYSLLARAEGYLAQTIQGIGANAEGPILLEMNPVSPASVGTLSIHLTDSFSIPILGGMIQLYTSEGKPILTINSTFTDAQGNASLKGVPSGAYLVKATKYPFTGNASQIVEIENGITHQVDLSLPLTILEYFTNPGISGGETLPPFFPCETDCLPEMIFTLEGETTLPAYVALETKGTLLNAQGGAIPYATAYLSAMDPVSGISYIVSKSMTQENGNVSLFIPASTPGMQYSITVFHSAYSPAQSFLSVQDGILNIQPSLVELQLPYYPGASGFELVGMHNPSELSLTLDSLAIIPSANTLLNEKGMHAKWTAQNGSLSWTPSETKGVHIPGVVRNTIPIFSATQEEGEFLLVIASDIGLTWVQSLPFTATFSPLGGCASSPILVQGLGNTPVLEAASFNPIGSQSFTLANGCMVDGIPYPLQNLTAHIKWNGKPLGQIAVSLTDPLTGKKITQTLQEGGPTALLPSFWTQDAVQYTPTLSFIPYSTEIVSEGSISLILRAELGEGVNHQDVETIIPFTARITRLDSCVKVTPNPPTQIKLSKEDGTATFTIQTNPCGVPVDVELCGESGNNGCSGGAPLGKINLSKWKIDALSGSQTIHVTQTNETIPGVYDITLRARAGTSGYERLGSVTVSVPSPDEYAFSLQKGHFSLNGKKSQDASDVVNRLLEEPVAVTAAVCDWMEVEIDDRLEAAYNAYSITSTITTIVAIPGGGCGAPCLVLAIYVGILTYLFYGTEEVDLCAIFHTQDDMQDYVINLTGITGDDESLPPDALDILLSGTNASHFTAHWGLDNPENFKGDQNGAQRVGVVLTNTTGYANPTPTFLVMTLRATEHIHGDPDHTKEGEVMCTNSKFNNYKIGPQDDQGACEGAEDVTREEPFHIRIKTAEAPVVSPLLVPPAAQSCDAGFIQGYTGEGAVPRVAFNWRWDEEKGIPLYACDERNPNSIYCDATQFNIDLMKRIRAVEEFLRANNYSFDCPAYSKTTPDTLTIPNTSGTPDALLGVNSFTYDFQTGQEITFFADVFNQHPLPKDITLTAYLLEQGTAAFTPNALENASYACTITQTIPGVTTFPAACTIKGITPGTYTLIWKTTAVADQKVIGIGGLNLDTLHYAGLNPLACDTPHSTDGLPQWIDPTDPELGQFVNESTVTYTKQVPSIQALNELLHFEARLIQDGYSKDFKDDFQHYYRTNSFADAPYWFKGAAGEPGYYYLYQEDLLTFRNRHYEGTAFPASGTYRVDLDIDMGDDWKFFDADGKPKVSIEVNVVHLADPVPNSPFYRLPLNGEVGLENGNFDRKGYGVNFINEGGFINLNDYPIKTYTNTAGSEYAVLTTKHVQDIQSTNSTPETRGQLLHVNVPAGNQGSTLTFAPTIATPVLLRIEGEKGKPFTAFYQLSHAGNPVDVGDVLTYWSGVPQCAAFSGIPSYPTYYHTPDRHGKDTDPRTDWALLYALDFASPTQNGHLYLETILYTPVGGSYTLNAESPTLRVWTPNYPSYSSVQFLDGIKQLGLNNASENVNSIQDVFDLVAKNAVCVSDDGVTSRFFWNPEQLHQEKGTIPFVQEIQSLTPGNTCLPLASP